eukprot:266626-Hanusia_phi.AAC.1
MRGGGVVVVDDNDDDDRVGHCSLFHSCFKAPGAEALGVQHETYRLSGASEPYTGSEAGRGVRERKGERRL